MPFTARQRHLLATTSAILCLFATGGLVASADAAQKPKVATAQALTGPSAKHSACARPIVRTAARPAVAARNARRARARLRRCRARQRQAAQRQRAKTSLVPTQAPGNLVIGVDGGYTGWSDSEIEQREQLNAAITRHEWDPAKPVDEQDDVMEVAASEIHTRVHALLGGNELGDPNHYREWVVAFVRRYGVGGSFWAEHPDFDPNLAITTIELGNEPYFGEMSPQEYAATVQPTLEEIQRLALPVQVVLPSRVYGSNTSWMDTLYELIPNLNSLFYAFADHPYWYGHDPAEASAAGPFARIETLRQRMNENGASAKPIFITEYGESTASCGSECTDEGSQALHLQKMINAIVARPDWGVKMLSVFQLRDRGTASPDRELQFGLLRQDGSPKPVYGIVQAAMQQYRG